MHSVDTRQFIKNSYEFFHNLNVGSGWTSPNCSLIQTQFTIKRNETQKVEFETFQTRDLLVIGKHTTFTEK